MTEVIDWLVEKVSALGIEGVFRRFYGTYPGIVEDVEDPEKRGRARIRVLALGQKRAPQDVWAKPISFGGTKGSGHFWPPSVGDQVWVQFEGGQSSKPLFLGGFMARPDVPPEFNDPFKRGMKTPRGHWFRMSDDPEDPHITIASADGGFFNLNKDGEMVASSGDGAFVRLSGESGTTLFDANGSLISLKDGEVSIISSDGSFVSVKGGNVSVVAGKGCTIKAAGKVVISAGSIDLGDGAVQGVVLGPALAALFNTHTHIAAAPGSPTSPPVVPMTVAQFSSTVKSR